jgi:eukaryotic-like serine/threonine-protein kinase
VEIFQQLAPSCKIAKILNAFQHEQELYLIQEYIGVDLLSKKLKLDRSVGIATALTLLVEMLEILQSLHQYQLWHQHLDANCFAYDRDGKLVLFDLGITARLSTKLHQTEGNNQNIYQIPTQWNERATASSDIYTVATIVLHALTGTAPDCMSIDPKTGEIQWRDLCIVAESFAQIINKTICKDPRNRYPSIEAVRTDLDRLPMVSMLLKPDRLLVTSNQNFPPG